MDTLFPGFGICGYRSFHGEMQFVGPLKKVTLLAGQNNSGKSNVIRFLTKHLHQHATWRPDGLDIPRGPSEPQSFKYALCLPDIDELLRPISGNLDANWIAKFKSVLGCDAFKLAPGSDRSWIEFEPARDSSTSNKFSERQADNVLHQYNDILRALSSQLTSNSGGSKYDDYNRVMGLVAGRVTLPRVEFIDAFRQIRPRSEGQSPHTGAGLIEEISKLQNPGALEQPIAEQKYRAINNFISSVLEEDATLNVPHDGSTLNVRMRGDVVLPLEHQGTGLHQVMIIATAATILEDTLVCIEEPEINLHPILQRRLLRYLTDNTTNQYIIATHSAQMLDYEQATVLHLTHGSSGTTITPAATPAQVSNICVDLGYRPSDLLQANAIIWVEGPSDRIYLRHWISEADPSLIEGVHFSIMFYGGSLLRDLAFDDPAITEFVNLRRLNRHTSVIIDSDKKSSRAKLNPTKRRVIEEYEGSSENGFVWITDGYTMENYVPADILSEAVMAVHPRKGKAVIHGLWADPLQATESPDKPKIARLVVANWENCLVDRTLRHRVDRLVEFTRAANAADKVRL